MDKAEVPERIWIESGDVPVSDKMATVVKYQYPAGLILPFEGRFEYVRADLVSPAPVAQSDHDEIGLALFRQLVCGKNALRQLDVFGCNDGEHAVDCKCFWEQCETWSQKS